MQADNIPTAGVVKDSEVMSKEWFTVIEIDIEVKYFLTSQTHIFLVEAEFITGGW